MATVNPADGVATVNPADGMATVNPADEVATVNPAYEVATVDPCRSNSSRNGSYSESFSCSGVQERRSQHMPTSCWTIVIIVRGALKDITMAAVTFLVWLIGHYSTSTTVNKPG